MMKGEAVREVLRESEVQVTPQKRERAAIVPHLAIAFFALLQRKSNCALRSKRENLVVKYSLNESFLRPPLRQKKFRSPNLMRATRALQPIMRLQRDSLRSVARVKQRKSAPVRVERKLLVFGRNARQHAPAFSSKSSPPRLRPRWRL